MTRRVVSVVSTGAALALGIGLFAAVDANSGDAADGAAVPVAVKSVVRQSVGAPRSPLRADAASMISRVGATPGGQTFYRAPTDDGGSCLITPTGLLSSCLTSTVRDPGTVTLADDASNDDQPAIVFGQVTPEVTAVSVSVTGKLRSADLADGVYSLTLPGAETSLDDVKKVHFTLANGRVISRLIHR